MSATAAPSDSKRPLLFGTNEIRSDRLEKFRKWTDVMARYENERPQEMKACEPTRADPCHIARWRIFLKKIADRPVLDQLRLVNKAMNKWTYILDPINYGVEDYWATPAQFMYRNGDCEDYAITKYLSLRQLGFPEDRMRIVVLQDLNLGIPHAILVVYVDGKALVLDNQISQVIEASRIKHYKPIYSINQAAWWLHRG